MHEISKGQRFKKREKSRAKTRTSWFETRVEREKKERIKEVGRKLKQTNVAEHREDPERTIWMEMVTDESKCCGIVASGFRQCVCVLSTFSSVHSPALPYISNSPTWSGHPLPPEDSRNVEMVNTHILNSKVGP